MLSHMEDGYERPLAGSECLFDSLRTSLDPVVGIARVHDAQDESTLVVKQFIVTK